jgi:hypothetical protein
LGCTALLQRSLWERIDQPTTNQSSCGFCRG